MDLAPFSCFLPLPQQAGAHPHCLCLGVRPLASVGSRAASPKIKQKGIYCFQILSSSLQNRSVIKIVDFRVQLVLGCNASSVTYQLCGVGQNLVEPPFPPQ